MLHPMSPLKPVDLDAIHQLAGCRMLPGSWGKRFARDLDAQVSHGAIEISVKQMYWLWKLCCQFRRQLKGAVREEAILRRSPAGHVLQPSLYDLCT